MTRKQLLWETVSNLAYPLAGLWTGEPVFFAMMLGLGLSSAYYHANGGKQGTRTSAKARLGANWDVGAIYAVLLFLALAIFGLPLIFIPAGVIPAAFWLRMKQMDVPMETKIGGLMAVILGFGFSSGIVLSATSALATFGLSSAVLLAALAIRKWFNHGLWHVVSACGLALVWYGITLLR